jgi:hypothetical protein
MSAAAKAVPQAMSGAPNDLSASLEQLKAFAAAAPEEIRADLMLVYQTYGEFVAAMQASGYDPTSGQTPSPQMIAAMQSAVQKFQDPNVKAASKRVSAWFKTTCGS